MGQGQRVPDGGGGGRASMCEKSGGKWSQIAQRQKLKLTKGVDTRTFGFRTTSLPHTGKY